MTTKQTSPTRRIEIILALTLVLGFLVFLFVYFLDQGDIKSAAHLIAPFIISIGVVVAIDNLITSERNRHSDKVSEESRFRFELCIKQLERLSILLSDTSISKRIWSNEQLDRASIIFKSFNELKKGVIDEHQRALLIEETIHLEQIKDIIRQSKLSDYCSFLGMKGNDNKNSPELINCHNAILLTLQADELDASHWDTNPYKKLPQSIDLFKLMDVVHSVIGANRNFCINRVDETLDQLSLEGMGTLEQFVELYISVERNNDGTLKLCS